MGGAGDQLAGVVPSLSVDEAFALALGVGHQILSQVVLLGEGLCVGLCSDISDLLVLEVLL